MRAATAFLASAPAPMHTRETLFSDVLPWLILLFGLVIAGGVIIFWARRSLQAAATQNANAAGFSLHELRELHKNGELTDEEFERARAAIIGAVGAKPTDQTPSASDNDRAAN